MIRNIGEAGRWWRTPLIPALGSQRQVDLCEFKASLVYIESFSDTILRMWPVTELGQCQGVVWTDGGSGRGTLHQCD